MPAYQFVTETSKKFWEIDRDSRVVTMRWGRIGSAGQAKTTRFASEVLAQSEIDKRTKQKLKEGYTPVGVDAQAQPGAKTKKAAPVPNGVPRADFKPSKNYMDKGKPFAAILEKIVKLAAKIPGPRTPIYLYEIAKDDAETTASSPITRIGGPLPGKKLPKGMTHHISIDLREVPELAARYPGYAALSLVVPAKAYGMDEVSDGKVLFHTEAELATSPGVGGAHRPLRLHRIEVPAAVFNSEALSWMEDEIEEYGDVLNGQQDALNALYKELYVHHGLLGNFNRLPDTKFEGPSDGYLLSISDAYANDTDGRLVVFCSRVERSSVSWVR